MNNECGFWFWFIRPFAEILAGVAIIIGVAVFMLIAHILYAEYERKRKTK